METSSGFVPPPYPQDRLGTLARLADAIPGGMIDLSVGNPVDAVPSVVSQALVEAGPRSSGYPVATGNSDFKEAAVQWIKRRFEVDTDPTGIVGCMGTKELIAMLPRILSLRDPGRDTILYPAVSYPTYEMGARLAGLRAVPVPVDETWHIDLSRVAESDAERSLMLWINEPSNPTATVADRDRLTKMVGWARDRGIVAASDECYVDFSTDFEGKPVPLATALQAGEEKVLSIHSLSKRSNMAGFRAGFIAGDPDLAHYIGEVRRHAGMMVPTPIQAAATAALSDDTHVEVQRDRYVSRRQKLLGALEDFGYEHDGGPMPFYLWIHDADGTDDGWEIAADFAEAGALVMPGDLYGPIGADHARVSLAVTDEKLDELIDRLGTAKDRR